MKLIIEFLLIGLLVFLISKFQIITGVEVTSYSSALVAGILIALANSTIGFILRLLTFPINFFTLGIMSFIISALMVLLVGNCMETFHVAGFKSAVFLAIAVAIFKALYSLIAGDKD